MAVISTTITKVNGKVIFTASVSNNSKRVISTRVLDAIKNNFQQKRLKANVARGDLAPFISPKQRSLNENLAASPKVNN